VIEAEGDAESVARLGSTVRCRLHRLHVTRPHRRQWCLCPSTTTTTTTTTSVFCVRRTLTAAHAHAHMCGVEGTHSLGDGEVGGAEHAGRGGGVGQPGEHGEEAHAHPDHGRQRQRALHALEGDRDGVASAGRGLDIERTYDLAVDPGALGLYQTIGCPAKRESINDMAHTAHTAHTYPCF
jgi:hypothetical protein